MTRSRYEIRSFLYHVSQSRGYIFKNLLNCQFISTGCRKQFKMCLPNERGVNVKLCLKVGGIEGSIERVYQARPPRAATSDVIQLNALRTLHLQARIFSLKIQQINRWLKPSKVIIIY